LVRDVEQNEGDSESGGCTQMITGGGGVQGSVESHKTNIITNYGGNNHVPRRKLNNWERRKEITGGKETREKGREIRRKHKLKGISIS